MPPPASTTNSRSVTSNLIHDLDNLTSLSNLGTVQSVFALFYLKIRQAVQETWDPKVLLTCDLVTTLILNSQHLKPKRFIFGLYYIIY